ncbi:MAG TPA: energy transducer TonB [Pyrinomonadaceae bacterium]
MKVKLTTLICITFLAFASVQGLPYGLTENAVDAAKKIKYFPAIKDGKRVSMWMQLEYNFNLY